MFTNTSTTYVHPPTAFPLIFVRQGPAQRQRCTLAHACASVSRVIPPPAIFSHFPNTFHPLKRRDGRQHQTPITQQHNVVPWLLVYSLCARTHLERELQGVYVSSSMSKDIFFSAASRSAFFRFRCKLLLQTKIKMI
jgi:hypothetical protein